MLDLLFSNPPAFAVIFCGIIVAIGIHEAAHCYMADYLGDPTPRSLGRLSLNPLNHLDPMGTLVILITGMFGWGKPSPFDPYNLKSPRRDTALIALAGPVTNVVLAIILSLIIKLIPLPTFSESEAMTFLSRVFCVCLPNTLSALETESPAPVIAPRLRAKMILS